MYFITSFARKKEVMFAVALVCLSIFLFVGMLTTLLERLGIDCDEVLWRGPEWEKKEVIITFWLR